MLKEGWRFGLGIAATILLFMCGVMIVRPFPWLMAREAKMEGKIMLNNQEYNFTGENYLKIDDLRSISGKAVAWDGNKIYFDKEGAEVKVDELGYLYGRVFSDIYGLIDIGPSQDRVLNIGKNGDLSGSFIYQDMDFSWEGNSSWHPYELAELKVPSKVDLTVGSQKKIDVSVLALGGKKLSDVQLVWEANNSALTVDEYGYVSADREGYFPEALTVQAGQEVKAITLQADIRIDKIILKPSVVTVSTDTDLELVFTPDNVVNQIIEKISSGQLNSNNIKVSLVRGGEDRVDCSTSLRDRKMFARCIFAKETDAGSWNLEFSIEDNKFVYPAALSVIKKDNAVNMTINATLVGSDCANNTDQTLNIEEGGCKTIDYKVIFDWPSGMWGSNVNGVVKVNFAGEGVNISGQSVCSIEGIPDATSPTTISQSFSFSDISGADDKSIKELNGSLTDNNYVEVKAANLQGGCDFVAKATVEFNVENSQQGLNLQGLKADSEVRIPVGGRKRLTIKGDILVEEGDLQVKRLEEDQNLYLLVASDKVNATSEQGGVSGYELDEDTRYSQIVAKIKDKVDKLVTERGLSLNSNNPDDLEVFTLDDKQKSPEGRILYNDWSSTGDFILENTGGSELNICAPTTLVVYGRDVYIKDNIIMSNVADNVTSGYCVAGGNFGLIVFDGDIYFAGDENSSGPVNTVEGFYFTTGTIHTGVSHEKFVLRGVAFAHDYVLARY